MSGYNARVPAAQQYQLIMECRSSGLSDYRWCKEHGIHPGTFYNWVSRLRKKACYEIPKSISREAPTPSAAQEVVRLNLSSRSELQQEPVVVVPPALKEQSGVAETSAKIEISFGNATIRIANGTEPEILERILCFMKGMVCQAISR